MINAVKLDDMSDILEVKRKVTTLRISEQKLIEDWGEKMGPETTPVHPEDLRLMYVGKLMTNILKMKVAASNQLKGYERAYGETHPEVLELLMEDLESFEKDFERTKKRITKLAEEHPLSEQLCKIKGFTPYSLALIMAYVKDIGRFDTPSRLCVYAGVAPKGKVKVCKRNINELNRLKQEAYTGEPDDYKNFGYNTELQGRMYVIADCLMRAGGWFYNHYGQIRQRITERAINDGMTFKPSPDEMKASKGKMKPGQLYMLGRVNQSLEAWTNSGAKVRLARILLHLVYTEWRTLRGMTARNPYPIDYLGHNSLITLQDVLRYEAKE